ncbi:HlyD family secretion protein [Pseudochelatococcus contaminans]|uniref:Membrane fusion protein (Multidrug efflux system) n=1 Tax=Pseudochelatococcus contaminans TaxID=1538103 RepID=A0A7W5Z3W9_9HYPH|nr:HlyD family secretion protein [Pseudochelatococcus contaminans]MBB3809695.1 membrane fusion protein (multidrug efflux system) [Pseudochelatococcus contaminans]
MMNTVSNQPADAPDQKQTTATGSAPVPPPAAPKTSDHKGFRTLLLAGAAVVVLAVAAWAGWQYWTVWQYEISTDDAYLHADFVNVAPEVSGYVIAVNVQDNEPVKKGDVIAVIDPVPYQAAVAEAEATVSYNQALAAQTQAELDAQPALVDEAKASVAVSEAALKFAQENMARFGTLANEGFGTQQARQEATSQLGQAQARLDLNRAAVIAAERRIATLKAGLAASEASIKESQAALQKARFSLERTTLRAPIDGVVGNRALRLGMFVQPGSQLLAIVPLEAIYVRANVKETNLAVVEPGLPVSISVDAFPDRPLRGVIASIAPAAGQIFALLPPDNATGNFTKVVQRVPVRIAIDPHDELAGRLRPGMSVTTTIQTRGERVDPATFGAGRTAANGADAGAAGH